MRSKLIRRFFPIFVILLLAPWPIAHAHALSDGAIMEETAQIKIAETSAQPTWNIYGKEIGGVTPGELFYIDRTDNPADITATLYITNAEELTYCYQYLILEVGIYAEREAGEWELISTDTFITMRNGRRSFTLSGLGKYKITIDGGSFHCITTGTDGGNLSPQFYLEMN